MRSSKKEALNTDLLKKLKMVFLLSILILMTKRFLSLSKLLRFLIDLISLKSLIIIKIILDGKLRAKDLITKRVNTKKPLIITRPLETPRTMKIERKNIRLIRTTVKTTVRLAATLKKELSTLQSPTKENQTDTKDLIRKERSTLRILVADQRLAEKNKKNSFRTRTLPNTKEKDILPLLIILVKMLLPQELMFTKRENIIIKISTLKRLMNPKILINLKNSTNPKDSAVAQLIKNPTIIMK